MANETQLGAAFVFGFLTAIVATPLAIRVATRAAFYDHPERYKAHAGPTPYLGGAAVLTGVALCTLLLAREWSTTLPILGGVFLLWTVGTIDDRRTVRPIYRLTAAAAAATLLWATDLGWSPFDKEAGNLVFTILWVVGLVNAFNLMDNMDGAAVTITCVCSVGVAAVALIESDAAIAVIAVALAGASLGFLPYNLAKPARIFLGDGGSMPIGFVVAAALMALSAGDRTSWDILVPATFVVGLPILDTGLVIFSRGRRGAPIWKGGRDHLTHRLLLRWGSARKVAAMLAATQTLLCVAALFVFEAGTERALAAAAVFVGLATLAVFVLEKPQRISMLFPSTTPASARPHPAAQPSRTVSSILVASSRSHRPHGPGDSQRN